VVYPLSSKIAYVISLVVFAVGIAVTMEWLKVEKQSHITVLEEQFNQYAAKSHSAFQQKLQREIERLIGLTAVYDFSEVLSQDEFSRYAQVLLAKESHVQALEWVELIEGKHRLLFEHDMAEAGYPDFVITTKKAGELSPAPEKELHAVIKFTFPLESNRKVIGLDAYLEPSQKKAMLLADITNSAIATPPQYLLQHTNGNYFVIVYHPVYSESNQLKGFAALVLNVADLLHSLRDNASVENSLGIFLIDSDANQAPFALDGIQYSVNDELYRTSQIYLPFAGRNWQFHTEVNLTQLPEYQIYAKQSDNEAFLTGLLMSVLLSLVTFLLIRNQAKSAESESYLREQEKRYRTIISQSSEAFLLLGDDGQILDVNEETVKQLGYTRDELLMSSIADIDQQHSSEEIVDTCQALQPDKKLLIESKFLRKDGCIISVEISASKLRVGDEFVTCAFVRDLTERLSNRVLSLTNEELQQAVADSTKQLNMQKQAFETIFEKSTDGIFISEGRHVIDCNQAIVDIFGYQSKEQLLSLPNRVFAPKYQPDGELSYRKGFRMLQICLDKGSHRYEWVNRRSNGEPFWTDVVLTRLEYFGRTVVHIAIRDISKRKQLEQEMLAARETAVLANQSKSDFLAKMSHEIRTPLHGVLTYAQMGESRLDKLTPEKLKRYFSNIAMSGERLMGLLNDLLDAAKLESGMMTFDFHYQAIKPIIESCIEEQGALLNEKHIQVEVKLIDYMAFFDKQRVSQVISNLLNNAIRHTPIGQKIQISIENKEDWITFVIQDSGPGLDDNELSSVFEKFIQSNNVSKNTQGTGLGLTISREIITAHNGKIWAENLITQNKVCGAVFKFTLPTNEHNRKKPHANDAA